MRSDPAPAPPPVSPASCRPRHALRAACALAALGVLVGPLACEGDPEPITAQESEVCLPTRSGGQVCIETYEASRKDATATSAGVDDVSLPRSVDGVLPWADVTWAAARDACARKNKRLCERADWVDACDGAVGEDMGLRYPYGDTVTSTTCNVSGTAAVATGANAACRSPFGAFDLSGNLWEWTGTQMAAAATRGGAWSNSRTHECKGPDRAVISLGETSPQVGFRCCRDL